MQIHTERLTLRPLGGDDAQIIWQLRSDPDIYKWTISGRWKSIHDAQAWIVDVLARDRDAGFNYVVKLRDRAAAIDPSARKLAATQVGGQIVGSLSINADGEIGFIIHRSFRGMGLAAEAITASLQAWYAQNGEATHVTAQVDETNVASISLLRKLGFQYVSKTAYHNVELGPGVLMTWFLAKPNQDRAGDSG